MTETTPKKAKNKDKPLLIGVLVVALAAVGAGGMAVANLGHTGSTPPVTAPTSSEPSPTGTAGSDVTDGSDVDDLVEGATENDGARNPDEETTPDSDATVSPDLTEENSNGSTNNDSSMIFPSVEAEWKEFSVLNMGEVQNTPTAFGETYTLWPLTGGGFLVSEVSNGALHAIIGDSRDFTTFQMEQIPRFRQGGGFSKYDGRAVYRFDSSLGAF